MNYVEITISIAHDYHFIGVNPFHSEYVGNKLSLIHPFAYFTSISTSLFIFIYSASPRHIFTYFHYASQGRLASQPCLHLATL